MYDHPPHRPLRSGLCIAVEPGSDERNAVDGPPLLGRSATSRSAVVDHWSAVPMASSRLGRFIREGPR